MKRISEGNLYGVTGRVIKHLITFDVICKRDLIIVKLYIQ